MMFKPLERIEVIFGPLPRTSSSITMASLRRREVIDWILGREGKIDVCSSRSFREFHARRNHDLVGKHIPSSCFQVMLFVSNDVVFGLCQDAIRLGCRRPLVGCLPSTKRLGLV